MISHIDDPELTPEEGWDGIEDYEQCQVCDEGCNGDGWGGTEPNCPYSNYIEDEDE